jgi:hypothetical protein
MTCAAFLAPTGQRARSGPLALPPGDAPRCGSTPALGGDSAPEWGVAVGPKTEADLGVGRHR